MNVELMVAIAGPVATGRAQVCVALALVLEPFSDLLWREVVAVELRAAQIPLLKSSCLQGIGHLDSIYVGHKLGYSEQSTPWGQTQNVVTGCGWPAEVIVVELVGCGGVLRRLGQAECLDVVPVGHPSALSSSVTT